MSEIRIEIPGVPIAKKRPKFFRRGAHVGIYNPQQSEESKTMWHISEGMKAQSVYKPIVDPVSMEITFRMPIPESTSKKARASLVEHPEHTKKPDLDNLIKHVMDSANGILFVDDRQIHSLVCRKQYAEQPGVQIKVTW